METTLSPRSVLIVHRRPLLAEALGRLVEEAGHAVAGCTADVDAALRILWDRPVDVVLFDADAATAGVRDLPGLVRREAPLARLILLALEEDPAIARWSLDNGVDGVVLCSGAGGQLTAAIEQVTAGQAVYPCGWLKAAREDDERAGRLQLSSRQLEVLELLASGCSNEQIARRLVISTNTVKFHIAAIYERLGVHTRVEAAAALTGSESVLALR
jgi:two-component system, NarL family, response regulator NreC